MRREEGFTLVELLISMAMFIIVIASVSSVFVPLLTQFKQQSKSAESQIEGIIGLELLRRDIKHAGFGLPWRMNGAAYREAEQEAGGTPWVDRVFNDGPPDNPARGTDAAGASNAPGAIRSDNLGLNTSDVLVLKAANLAINDESQRWTHLGAGNVKRNGLSGENFENSDRVIVISPGNSDASRRGLVLSDPADATSWRTAYNSPVNSTLAFAPNDTAINIIYGIKPNDAGVNPLFNPRMPFNRTEYYIKIPATMPNQCAGGTGILYKSALSHTTGTHTGTEDPLLDCVADFQVVYTLNTGALADDDDTFLFTAAEIRERISMVTVYILAQEGQKDPTNCTIANPCVSLVAPNTVRVGPDTGQGRDFNFNNYAAFNTSNNRWQNFRWKVYTITVILENLG